MKLTLFLNRNKYAKQYTHLGKGKYSNTRIEHLDTQYISYALETFNLDEGMRFVLAQELNKRCNLKDYI